MQLAAALPTCLGFVKDTIRPWSALLQYMPCSLLNATIIMQVLVSQQGSSVYHVFKSEVQLPKFCMYCPADAESLPAASSSVRFSITERPAR